MQSVRYPDPAIEVIDRRFAAYCIGAAGVECLWTGGRWTEGPVWFGDGRFFLFSDIPNDRILRWDEPTGQTTLRSPAHYANGNTRDRTGRLVTCEHQTRSVTRTEYDGRQTVLIDSFEGKRLNAPNDVVVAADGAIWFTDPGYGILSDYEGGKASFELPTCIYRLDAESGRASVMADDLDRPNGLCFSPDERFLYAVDSGDPKNIRVFEVEPDAVGGPRLTKDCVFVDSAPGTFDGIRVDVDGNVWAGGAWGGESFDGVHCFAPDGTRIGQIHLPEGCSNICFGGARKDRLFMTASRSLYTVYLNTKGVQWP